jgi:hypothetical protein
MPDSIIARNANLPGVELFLLQNELEKGAFPVPVSSDKTQAFARIHLKIDVTEKLMSGIGFRKTADFNHNGFCH